MFHPIFCLKRWIIFLFLCNLSNSSYFGEGQLDESWLNDPSCGASESFPNNRRPKLAGKSKTFRMLDFDLLDLKLTKSRGRIIDGEIAKHNAWPWQVSIQLNVTGLGNVGHWCGGVLINPSWVLTAAHCVTNNLLTELDGLSWTIRTDSSTDINKSGIQIDDIIIHPEYENYQNDIALLHVKDSPSKVPPVCLPSTLSTQNETFLGIRCMATGWGQTHLGGKMQSHLHQVELTVVENRHCGLVYGVMYNIPVGPNHLCAGPILSGGKGTCVGDSGGPLHCNMKDGRWYLAGLTSFGSGCAKPGFPDVFTRITAFNQWIQHTIEQRDNLNWK